MVNYICPICSKQFKQKSHYIDHTENKKKPCKPKTNLIIEQIPIFTNFDHKITNIYHNLPKLPKQQEKVENVNNNIDIESLTTCKYCYKSFTTIYTLQRHLKDRCKVRKLDKDKKEEIFNNLIEKEEKFNLLLKNFELLQQSNHNLQNNYKTVQESNKNLQKQIKELENKLKESNKTYDEKIKNVITKNINSNNTINNNNTVNNIIIPSDKLVNFGKEDLSKIDYVTILKTIFNPFIGGVKLYEELLKLIHFNPKFPEFQNIYMSDRNREKYMCYEDSDWKLSESAYNTIMEQINNLKEMNEDKFDEILQTEKHVYKNATMKLYREINKYYGEDDFGKRNTEFMKIVDTKLKTTLYNNCEIPKDNYKRIKDNIMNSTKATITNVPLITDSTKKDIVVVK